MTRLGERLDDVAPYPVQNALTQPLRQAAARANDGDYLSLWAGQGAALARRRGDALTTAQLVDALAAEWRAAA
ncbi:hypothetical protein [Burkholderia multivorans]